MEPCILLSSRSLSRPGPASGFRGTHLSGRVPITSAKTVSSISLLIAHISLLDTAPCEKRVRVLAPAIFALLSEVGPEGDRHIGDPKHLRRLEAPQFPLTHKFRRLLEKRGPD
jgi:hypothetical protein